MSKNSYAQERVSAAGDHRPSYRMACEINEASELLSQRMSGRCVGGGSVTVRYDPSQTHNDYFTDVCARFIEDHPDYGVILER